MWLKKKTANELKTTTKWERNKPDQKKKKTDEPNEILFSVELVSQNA